MSQDTVTGAFAWTYGSFCGLTGTGPALPAKLLEAKKCCYATVVIQQVHGATAAAIYLTGWAYVKTTLNHLRHTWGTSLTPSGTGRGGDTFVMRS